MEEMDNFMFQHRDLARGATDLTPHLTRDDKGRLWAELTCRLNHLGPPRTTERWKITWFNRVSKARKRCAVVEAESRKSGGGSSRMRLSSTYSRILSIVGVDSALGAPRFCVPYFPEKKGAPVYAGVWRVASPRTPSHAGSPAHVWLCVAYPRPGKRASWWLIRARGRFGPFGAPRAKESITYLEAKKLFFLSNGGYAEVFRRGPAPHLETRDTKVSPEILAADLRAPSLRQEQHAAPLGKEMPQPRVRRATVRPRLPRRVPRVSHQEWRDEVAFSAVAKQQRLLVANKDRDTREERFQEQAFKRHAESIVDLLPNCQIIALQVSCSPSVIPLCSHALCQPQPQVQTQPQPHPAPDPLSRLSTWPKLLRRTTEWVSGKKWRAWAPFQMGHVWLLKLHTTAAKEKLLATGQLQVKDCLCLVIDPNKRELKVKVHWVALDVPVETIRRAFEAYGEVKGVTREKWKVEGLSDVETTTVIVRLVLRDGMTPESLPHQLRFLGGTVLVVVPGRAPVCLRCRRSGHIRRECRVPRCEECRALGHDARDCVRSYARAVASHTADDTGMNHVMDEAEAEEAASPTTIAPSPTELQTTGKEASTAPCVTQNQASTTPTALGNGLNGEPASEVKVTAQETPATSDTTKASEGEDAGEMDFEAKAAKRPFNETTVTTDTAGPRSEPGLQEAASKRGCRRGRPWRLVGSTLRRRAVTIWCCGSPLSGT
ncbi:uncharacterized protein ISCGN_027241 [Ixodes scapularis]